MKKSFAAILMCLTMFMFTTPSFAQEDVVNSQNGSYKYTTDENKPLTSEIEEERVYLKPKSTYVLELESDIDVNEAKANDEIYFGLDSRIQASNGMYLPKDTRFVGKFKKIVPSKPLFKRAKTYIVIDKIILPNGNEYVIRMEPSDGHDLKSPQALNTLRAFPASIGIITFSVISVATVAIESVSIVGLVVVPRTCNGFGLLISSMAKGLNYKAKAGSKIMFKLSTPAYVQPYDLTRE